MRRKLLGALTAAALAAGLTLTAMPAQAATNPYTPRQICGSAYSTVAKSFRLNSGKGIVYVMKNPRTDRLCATTIKTVNIGTPTTLGVRLGPYHSDHTSAKDHDLYRYYAGPVYSSANCIWVGGTSGPDHKVFSGGWTLRYPVC